MKTIFKIIISILLSYIVLALITPYIPLLRKRSIENQINYIEKRLQSGDDNLLQRRYPEGKVFSNAIFALSTIQYFDSSSDTEAAKIIDNCIKRLLSERSKRVFDPTLNPKLGAFYNGWINLVLKEYIASSIFSQSAIQDIIIKQHRELSSNILHSVSDSLRYIETYTGGIWPADNLVCIASLDTNLDSLKKEWVHVLFEKTTTPSGLLHHVNSRPNEIRGSSQSLSIYFLNKVDPEIAIKKNEQFNDLLIDKILGIQFVREYKPPSQRGFDIDSGPILFNYGSVATIMNTKAQASLNNDSRFTWAFLNLLGIPSNYLWEKNYLFKKELMFDIFMLWCSVELDSF